MSQPILLRKVRQSFGFVDARARILRDDTVLDGDGSRF
jgi:hypothetical protein